MSSWPGRSTEVSGQGARWGLPPFLALQPRRGEEARGCPTENAVDSFSEGG